MSPYTPAAAAAAFIAPTTSTSNADAVRVCIIGGGAGAMFFCHAYNRQLREAQAQGRQAEDRSSSSSSSSSLPQKLSITCFERHDRPGGIWRDIRSPPTTAASDAISDDSAAYEELWTNGPCQSWEFHDYTFEEHFGKDHPPTVFLPRQDVTEYLMGRVTKEAPTFFEDYFQFNTEVLRVEEIIYHDDDGSDDNTKGIEFSSSENSRHRFHVTVRNTVTGQVTSNLLFDRCIWAAGENSQGFVPESLQRLFSVDLSSMATAEPKQQVLKEPQDDEQAEQRQQPAGESTGSSSSSSTFCLLHSTETFKIRQAIQDTYHDATTMKKTKKKVLIVGGGLSAEDLVLQCLKWGAGHVHVATRTDDSEITWTTQWPGNRATVHKEYGIHSVKQRTIQKTNNGYGTTTTLDVCLEEVEPGWPHGYKPYEDNDEEDLVVLRDIDIVILCTGYRANLSMLDPALIPVMGSDLSFYQGSVEQPEMRLDNNADPWFDWKNWKMSKDNVEYKFVGDIPAGQQLGGRMVRANDNHPDMYRGILFRNPNMMYLYEHQFDLPLLSLDVHAWLLCSYLTGRVSMPSIQELQEANRRQVLDQMDIPLVRYAMDEAYFQAIQKVYETNEDADILGDDDYEEYMFRLIAKVMQEGQYPGKSLGTYDKLNKTGKALRLFQEAEYYMRHAVRENIPPEEDQDEAIRWRTFRDDVVEVEDIYSIYTGTPARPLTRRWMELVGPNHSVKNGI